MLEKELAKFKNELPTLLRTLRGQFVLIHGEEVHSSWKTEDEAYEAGCDRFGTDPFLVMLVGTSPLVTFVDITPYADHQ